MKSLQGRRTGASSLPQILCQFENGKKMSRKITNTAEGWHRVLKRSVGHVQPTIFKFIDILRREQSAANNKRISFAGWK